MLARYTYPTGAAALVRNWETGGTYGAMLLTVGYVPDPTAEVNVEDVTAFEFTNGSYSRATCDNPARDIDLVYQRIDYTCDDIDFGTISGGETAAWLVIYEDVTDDSDSPLVASFLVDYTADGITPAVFVAPGDVAFRINTSCPADFS